MAWCLEGTNGFVPVFIPWFTDDDYREPVPKNFERTPDEEEIREKYSLDDEQLMFRRRKIAHQRHRPVQAGIPS